MRILSERQLLLLLAVVQFTHIVDFMVMLPLGSQLMRELQIGPATYTSIIAAYAISAGVVGLLSSPFIDRFDRRRLLLWAYAGFIAGTAACAVARSAPGLLVARAICGGFGGVSGSILMAIVSDVVPPPRRAAAVGIIMTAFSAAAAAGVPLGLILAQRFQWETPFAAIAALGSGVWLVLCLRLQSVRGHLDAGGPAGWARFQATLKDSNVWTGLAFMAALIFGHFSIIPLLAPHLVRNLALPEPKLPWVYMVGGLCTIVTGPVIGRLSDRFGHWRILAILTAVASLVILAIGQLGPSPWWVSVALGGLFFVFASGRFVPAQAILSMAVLPAQRGGFMSLTSCVRDLAAGLISLIAGWAVQPSESGHLKNVDRLSWLAVGAGMLCLWLARRVRPAEVPGEGSPG